MSDLALSCKQCLSDVSNFIGKLPDAVCREGAERSFESFSSRCRPTAGGSTSCTHGSASFATSCERYAWNVESYVIDHEASEENLLGWSEDSKAQCQGGECHHPPDNSELPAVRQHVLASNADSGHSVASESDESMDLADRDVPRETTPTQAEICTQAQADIEAFIEGIGNEPDKTVAKGFLEKFKEGCTPSEARRFGCDHHADRVESGCERYARNVDSFAFEDGAVGKAMSLHVAETKMVCENLECDHGETPARKEIVDGFLAYIAREESGRRAA